MSQIMRLFPRIIREMREIRGLTLTAFAAKMGRSKPYAHEIEQPAANLKEATIELAAIALGFDDVLGLVAEWLKIAANHPDGSEHTPEGPIACVGCASKRRMVIAAAFAGQRGIDGSAAPKRKPKPKPAPEPVILPKEPDIPPITPTLPAPAPKPSAPPSSPAGWRPGWRR